ncbi:hypothetical protein CF327_g3372 [Tilletia walkeri]|nr:hypothetical protein CF327_g3372 [Tilletia walkeri]
MHRRRASVVPICSQPFEPTSLIGRDPSSLSSCRRRAHDQRGPVGSYGITSENSSTSSSSSNLSQIGRGRRSADDIEGEEEEMDAKHFVYGDGMPVGPSPSTSSGSESSTSSSPSSSLSSSSSGISTSFAAPELFEAHLRYSQTLFTHTNKMWEADRLAIERSRESSSRDTVTRLGHFVGLLGSGGSSTTSSAGGRRRGRSASEATSASGKTKTHRRGKSEKI